MQYDLGARGHTGFGKVTPRKGSEELVPMPIITIDGRETTNARWPNDGFAKVASVANQGSTSGGNMSFAADSPNTALWGNAKNPCVFGYWKYNWAPDSYRITAVSGNVVTVDGVPSYGTREGGWYYVYNMLEELDSPGEWYIDSDTDILYIYPYKDIDKNTSVRMSFSDRDIVSVENCKNVTLEGIKISDSMGRGVSFKSSSDCMLKNCELYNLGREGVKFSNTVSCGIYSTIIHDVAASAVNVDNADFTSLKDSATTIDNCRIYKYAVQARANAPAIALNASVGVDITHNEIYDGPTAAISQLGFDNHIDYNKIHDVCTEASDYGAIYTYHTYYSAGNTINYNDIYNITGKGDDALGSTVAIYLDELSGGCEINGNIIRNTDLAYLSNGGRRITFTNNIITGISDKNGGASIYMYPFGLHNDTTWKNIQSYLALFPVTSQVYRDRFPELANEMNDMPRYPKYITFKNNVINNHGEIQILDCTSATIYRGEGYYKEELGNVFDKNEIINGDLGFADAEHGDYNLKDDSVVFLQIPGFVPTDYSQIGLYSEK